MNMVHFMQTEDGAELVHSGLLPDGSVRLYIERPDGKGGFSRADISLPAFTVLDSCGFTEDQIAGYLEAVRPYAGMILALAGQIPEEDTIPEKSDLLK